MLESIKKKPLHWALAASLLLHLIMFLSSGWLTKIYMLLTPAAAAVAEEPPPLILTFPENQRKNTVVETPESARRDEPPPEAEFASDKNALAQNSHAPDNLRIDKAFSDGVFKSADAAPAPEAKTDQREQQNSPSESMQEKTVASAQPFYFGPAAFNREALLGKQSPPPSASSQGSPGRDDQDSRSLEMGSFSLNTYQWDFAPYMLYLRRHVQSHIFPPPAFTHAGIISGKTRLRFRIYPDGRMEALNLIGYEGHESLMQTSMNAINLSVPFRRLPRDFPEPYLEITALFEYQIIK